MATVERPTTGRPLETTVVARRDLTPELMLLWLEKPAGFAFKPGQYCTIGLDGIERPYSIASAPHEKAVELFIENLPAETGVLTPRLWRLRVGDRVSMRPRAKGVFTLDLRRPNHLLVATVTGVAPYVGFIRDHLHRGLDGHRFYVFQGASYKDEFGYDDELGALSRQHPGAVTLVATVSRPGDGRNAGWAGETGRVNTIVERHADRFGLRPEDTTVYLCGHPGMIEDVKARMGARGFAVKEERFWKDQ